MHFICAGEKPLAETSFPQQMPWKLLQYISTIQLYLDEPCNELIQLIKYTLSLLSHQRTSISDATWTLYTAALPQEIFSLSPLINISQSDYKKVIINVKIFN
jgi:ATP-dependent Lhr-like helicase